MFTSPWASRNLKELNDSFKLIITKKKITLSCKDNNKESTKLPPVHGLFLVSQSRVICSVDCQYHWDPSLFNLYLALDAIA